MRAWKTWAVLGVGTLTLVGCGTEDGPIPITDPVVPDPGSLVTVTTDSQVGVLLEDFPAGMRDRVADALIAKDEAFWLERAKQHMRMTMVRLNFRHYFYEPYYYTDDGRKQLPLPVEELWKISFQKGRPQRVEVDGHDVVAVGYHFETTILATPESPGQSDPGLADVGGSITETFNFPIDPTLQLEHSGYACMDEYQYPPDGIDSENTVNFFDDTCTGGKDGICHVTEQSDDDCVVALQKTVGVAPTTFTFTHVAWDQALADSVRLGEIATTSGAQMRPRTDALAHNRVEYRYFSPSECAIDEQCVGAPGWRRLLKFDSMDHNIGKERLYIGQVNYAGDPKVPSEEIENEYHNVFEWSACHKHYHFMHYGEFRFSETNAPNPKRGFCLESTNRLSNNENTPLYTNLGDCNVQGIETGWGDLYQGGLPCQWIDITDLNSTSDPVLGDLSFHSNPDGFLCEGTLVSDEEGNQVWEPTLFTTKDGDAVDRMACVTNPGAAADNIGKVAVRVEQKGGFMTEECKSSQVGPLRTCGFTEVDDGGKCTPGETVTLSCSVASPNAPMVARLCEKSAVLGVGTACFYRKSLANVTVESGTVDVTFKCPEARDPTEPGGAYVLYTAPAYPDDPPQALTCVVKDNG